MKPSRVKLLRWGLMTLLGFFYSMSYVFAENIDRQAFLLVDRVAIINEGKSVNLFRPLISSKAVWKDTTPYSGKPDMVELWFPTPKPVTINSIRFNVKFDAIRAGYIQTLKGRKWERIAELPPGRGTKKVSFKKPVITRALRFVITKQGDMDHPPMEIRIFSIDGFVPGQKALYDPAGLTLECTAPQNVFDLPNPARIDITVTNTGGLVKSFRTVVRWEYYKGFPLNVAPERKVFQLKKGQRKSFSAFLRLDEQGPYLATVLLYDNDRDILLAAKRIIVGLRDPGMFTRADVQPLVKAAPDIPSIEERLKQNGTIWTADATQTVGSGYPRGEFFRKISAAGGELVWAFMKYHDFEPLPGVYDLKYFDYMVKEAGKYHLGLSLGIWWWDFRGPSQWWMKDALQRERDGGTSGKGWSPYSLFSPKFTAHAKRAVEIMLKRYRNSKEVWLWYPHPYGVVDHDGWGIDDFNPDALKAWKKYLQKKYGLLTKLNLAWGTTYRTWNAVPVPEALWEKYQRDGKWEKASRVLDTRPEWVDWLDFYDQKLLDFRVEMMKLVRRYDKKRGISGVNACGGVGKADDEFRALKKYGAFYGDEAINSKHYVRLLIAKRRYGLRLRLEDVSPVTIGRSGFNAHNIIARSEWDVFQNTVLGADQFDYVFTHWDNSPFWDRVFANVRAKRIVKEASISSLVSRPVAYLHSFLTDIYVGKYNYQGISLYRWWLMGGFSAAMVAPGNFFEIFSAGGPLHELNRMKIVIDDDSRVLPESTVETLVNYVRNGGKLVLIAESGEVTLHRKGRFELLKRLGYNNTKSLTSRISTPAMLIFKKGNPVFRKTIAIPVHYYAELTLPENSTILGYIGEKPGAILWPYGKGQVVLIAGLPGSITEGRIQKLWSLWRQTPPKERKKLVNPWPLWANAERELGQVITSLTRDLSEWAGVTPQFKLNNDFDACLRRNGRTRLIYMYNNGPGQVPVLRINLPEGTYGFQVENLEKELQHGEINSNRLSAPGMKLPVLHSGRFMLVRIRPLRRYP